MKGCRRKQQLKLSSHKDYPEQTLITKILKDAVWDKLQSNSDMWHKARLNSMAAPHAGAYLDAAPNKTLDLRLTNAEIKSRVGRRLGMIMDEGGGCPMCWNVMDKYAVHCEACMSGGDKITGHNIIRDRINKHAQMGAMGPVLEAAKLLAKLATDGREGPGVGDGGDRGKWQ